MKITAAFISLVLSFLFLVSGRAFALDLDPKPECVVLASQLSLKPLWPAMPQVEISEIETRVPLEALNEFARLELYGLDGKVSKSIIFSKVVDFFGAKRVQIWDDQFGIRESIALNGDEDSWPFLLKNGIHGLILRSGAVHLFSPSKRDWKTTLYYDRNLLRAPALILGTYLELPSQIYRVPPLVLSYTDQIIPGGYAIR